MASPQVEKGHTRIANEILKEIIKIDLNGTQFRLVLVIWRYTYGFQKTEREFTLSFLAEKINTVKSHVGRELAGLIDRNIINVVGVGQRRGRILSFNKDYDEWKEQPVSSSEQQIPPKKIKKLKQNKKLKYDNENSYYKMALYFHALVSAVAKEAGVEHLIRKVNLQSWADDFRKLIELDGVDKHLAKSVMDWVTQDDFWKTNVLSARKLRDKFGELAIKMKNSQKTKQQPKPKPDTRDKEIEFQRWVQEGNNPDEFNWGN